MDQDKNKKCFLLDIGSGIIKLGVNTENEPLVITHSCYGFPKYIINKNKNKKQSIYVILSLYIIYNYTGLPTFCQVLL